MEISETWVLLEIMQGDAGLSPTETRALSWKVRGQRFCLPAPRAFKMLFSDILGINLHSFKEAVSGTVKHHNQTMYQTIYQTDIRKNTWRMDLYMEQNPCLQKVTFKNTDWLLIFKAVSQLLGVLHDLTKCR